MLANVFSEGYTGEDVTFTTKYTEYVNRKFGANYNAFLVNFSLGLVFGHITIAPFSSISYYSSYLSNLLYSRCSLHIHFPCNTSCWSAQFFLKLLVIVIYSVVYFASMAANSELQITRACGIWD